MRCPPAVEWLADDLIGHAEGIMMVQYGHEYKGLQRLRSLFDEAFGEDALSRAGGAVYGFAPGRVELAGNHTDHQGGQVISAAIEQGIYGLALCNGTSRVRIAMEGFGSFEIDLAQPCALEPRSEERGTSQALVRGMLVSSANLCNLTGFDMVTCGDLPTGCGLSSSAAFEMLVGVCADALFAVDDAKAASRTPLELALVGQEVERAFFDKPCGAQDQIASAFGGIVAMDFSEKPPKTSSLDFDFESSGYTLCLIDSKVDHSLHRDDFAAVPGEMRAVAELLGGEVLGDIGVDVFLGKLQIVRRALGDRAAMRAIHFYDETRRVDTQHRALVCGDFDAFLALARLAGASSAQYLQNASAFAGGADAAQPVMVILALCAHFLEARGAWRVHGGGFGGGVLAFVPTEEAAAFMARMDAVLGYEACMTLRISEQGARAVRLAV